MKPKTKTKGFAIIDTIVAIALVGLATIVVGLIYPGMRISEQSLARVRALSIAEKKMEELKAAQFEALALAANTAFSDADLNKLKNGSALYSVTAHDGDNDGNVENDLKKITVTVNWTYQSESKAVTLNSLVSKYGLAK